MNRAEHDDYCDALLEKAAVFERKCKPYVCKAHFKYYDGEHLAIGTLESAPDGRRLILYSGEKRWLTEL